MHNNLTVGAKVKIKLAPDSVYNDLSYYIGEDGDDGTGLDWKDDTVSMLTNNHNIIGHIVDKRSVECFNQEDEFECDIELIQIKTLKKGNLMMFLKEELVPITKIAYND